MNHMHMLSLIQSGFTTIAVTYPGERRTYTYKAKVSDGVRVGDTVVVDSPNSGLTLVEVVEVHTSPRIDLTATFKYKWIVQKVDRSGYDALLEQEAKFTEAMVEIERVKQRQEMRNAINLSLPEGTEARTLFDQAIKVIN